MFYILLNNSVNRHKFKFLHDAWKTDNTSMIISLPVLQQEVQC